MAFPPFLLVPSTEFYSRSLHSRSTSVQWAALGPLDQPGLLSCSASHWWVTLSQSPLRLRLLLYKMGLIAVPGLWGSGKDCPVHYMWNPRGEPTHDSCLRFGSSNSLASRKCASGRLLPEGEVMGEPEPAPHWPPHTTDWGLTQHKYPSLWFWGSEIKVLGGLVPPVGLQLAIFSCPHGAFSLSMSVFSSPLFVRTPVRLDQSPP